MGQFTRGYLMAFIGLKQHFFWFKHICKSCGITTNRTYLYLSIPIYTYLYLSIPIYTYLYLSIPIYTYLYLIQTRKNMETYQAAHPWRIHSMLIDCSMRVAPLVYQPTSLTSLTSTSMPPTTRISSCSRFMAGRALQIWDLQQTWQASWLAMNHFPK